MFDVPRDFSQQVVETILKPLQAEIDNLQETIFKVEASKGKIIADAIAAHRAQQRLSFNDTPQAAPQAPVGPKSTDAEFTPAVRTEYNQYLTHAIKTFPDKVFSILHNDLIKAGFVRDVRRLAKKDATAAIKLVAGRPSQRQHESYEPIDGAKFDLQANRTYTTLQNRGRTLLRKTGRPGRAGYIRRSEKKGQST